MKEFVEDISVDGMIYAVTVRSPVARGRLKEIKTPELPDSYYLIRAEDIPGKNELANFSIPVLAKEELSYFGQPVAILAGPDEAKLEEFLLKIEVTVEEEEPVFLCCENGKDNVFAERGLSSGNIDNVLGENKKTLSGTYITGIQDHFYAEASAVLVQPVSVSPVQNTKTKTPKNTEKNDEKNETFMVYTATQWPFHVKNSVASVLGCGGEKIIVESGLTTVHLDGKIWYPSLIACHAALASWISKSPVKLELTKEEDFLYSPKRNRSEISIRSGFGDKGEITGSDIQVKLDLGSQGIYEDEIMDQTCLGSLGLYFHPAYRISGAAMRTNLPPHGPMAGFGLSHGFFAAERHASITADHLGQDPADWRKNNFIKKNQNLAIGTEIKDRVPLAELIDAAASMSDYYRKWASYELLRKSRREDAGVSTGEIRRGIGIATACQGTGFLYNDETGNGNCAVEMTLEKNGSLEIKTSLLSSGETYLDHWNKLARDILGVDPALIQLTNNTGSAPDSGPVTLSRNIGSVTKLVERCCTAIRKQRFRTPLPITVKRSLKPSKAPGWLPEKNIDPETFAHPSWAAAVAEIEVNPVSYVPLLRGIWIAVDGGKILSQRRAHRAIRTGIIQALGWTCREQIYYDQGKIPKLLFRSYDIPSPAEIPPVYVDFIWNDTADPKGIGDLPFCCVPAAYVQAVSQAMDHAFAKIPLGAEDIQEAAMLKQAALET